MPTAWRIVKKRHQESAFDGEGARRYGGRWNSPGTAVIYASESRSLGLLEVLAGIRSLKFVDAYVIIPVAFDASLVTEVEIDTLPKGWRQSPPHATTQLIGDDWVTQERSVVLRVPSVLVPGEFNYVFNPARPRFADINVGPPQAIAIDSRLLPKTGQ